jgi:toxin-antitoxin system PIN domain toxin
LIAVDSNILVYAHRKDSQFHKVASMRVAELAEGTGTWAIPWPCVHEFLAIVTHPRIYAPPTPLIQALEQIEAWVESPTLILLAEPAGHWVTLRTLLTQGHVVGGRIHDARVAALCLTHSVRELWSADRDFSRFAGLKVVNPLLKP